MLTTGTLVSHDNNIDRNQCWANPIRSTIPSMHKSYRHSSKCQQLKQKPTKQQQSTIPSIYRHHEVIARERDSDTAMTTNKNSSCINARWWVKHSAIQIPRGFFINLLRCWFIMCNRIGDRHLVTVSQQSNWIHPRKLIESSEFGGSLRNE